MTDQQVSLVKKSWKIFQKIGPVLIEMLSVIVGWLDRLSELIEDTGNWQYQNVERKMN